MIGKIHCRMGQLAWESLSEEDREKWGLSASYPQDAPEFILKLPEPESVTNKIALYCCFLDLMGWNSVKLAKYPDFLMPNGKAVPHGAGDHNLNQCMTSSSVHDQKSSRVVLKTFIEKAVVEIKRRNTEKAALFAGLLAHFLQDFAALGHIFPNSMFYDFSPEETNKHIDYHGLIDSCEPKLTKINPDILGSSSEELVFRLGMLIEKNIQYGKRIFFDLLKACREMDSNEANRLIMPMLQNCIYQTASLWRSLLYINDNEFKAKTYNLLDATPYNCHPGGASYRRLIENKNVSGNKFIPLKIDFGDGAEIIENGIGLTSFFSARYLLEPNAFKYFKGSVGLSCECLDDQEPKMEVEFFVGLDNKYNCEVASDLNYGKSMKKIYSRKLKPGQIAEMFTVELGGAETLLFGAICRPSIIDGYEKYWFPHIVLAEPQLTNEIS